MIRFLIKGLLRDRSRSLFPLLTVVTGVTVTVFMQTYMAGITSNMSESSASFSYRTSEGDVESVRQGGRPGVERARLCWSRSSCLASFTSRRPI